MLQCCDCEFFTREASGRIVLRCDPFGTIKEPECLKKWQLLRLDGLLGAYHATLQWQQKIAPLQEKMFEFMKREMDDLEESDNCKYDDDDDDQENEEL